jgi:predicted NAD/FAD-dependent oxidoreductase
MHNDVLIVGAGLSGLVAAQRLAAQGWKPLILDKGRSVGGRLATRRISGGLADHGAQFFTVRSPVFEQMVNRWLEAGIAYQWSSGFSDGTKPANDGYPRYAVRGGMNALAKHLARELDGQADIRTSIKLTSIEQKGDGWQATDEQDVTYTASALLLTPPVPQSLALLGSTPLTPADRAALERIAYAPCVAGMFVVNGDVSLPEPGALQRPDAPISWIADNQRKGISPDARVITVHAGPDYSRQLWDVPEHDALAALRDSLQPFLSSNALIIEAEFKRWRYALPTVLHPERCLVADGLPPLAFAGDAFGEARMEGAALSGLAAAQALSE